MNNKKSDENMIDVSTFKHSVPEIWKASLFHVMKLYSTIYWNMNQCEYDMFIPVDDEIFPFEYHPYRDFQEYNFKYGKIKIKFYKNLGRGMSSNIELTPQMASDMVDDIVEKLRLIYKKYEEDRKYER